MSARAGTRPFRIALTGGIASGKSVVADLFAELGVPVIDTDVIAREVVVPGQPALDDIRKRFGEAMIDGDGKLDRAALRREIFSDQQARLDLEAILHPRIGEETRQQAAAAAGPYQLIVVPLLVGSPLAHYVDRILLIDCDEETQLERLMDRDAESVDAARRMLAAQSGRDERRAIADDIILNDAGLDKLRAAVSRLDRKYRRLAAHRYPHVRSPGNSGYQPR